MPLPQQSQNKLDDMVKTYLVLCFINDFKNLTFLFLKLGETCTIAGGLVDARSGGNNINPVTQEATNIRTQQPREPSFFASSMSSCPRPLQVLFFANL